jgi:hypothetical protein
MKRNILNSKQIQSFINDGFIRINNVFSPNLASEARDILWKDIPFNRNDRSTWTQPVIRLGMYSQEPFLKAANNPTLHGAFDQLVGSDKWLPCGSMGAFPVRFPSTINPRDSAWHVDAGFPGDDPTDFFNWRINIHSKGRGLLMLFLFSDVTELDAPTRILKGSHIEVAKLLKPKGDAGMSFMELAGELSTLTKMEEALATGKAGTVYLCHPFLVHAAQMHRGSEPKFMAQPPLLTKSPFNFNDSALSPVEKAIKLAL